MDIDLPNEPDSCRRALRDLAIQEVEARHIDHLLTNRIPEWTELEYKSGQLDLASPKGIHEFRKDAAAMASGGGGFILYGISEVSDTIPGHADGVADAIAMMNRMSELLRAGIEPTPSAELRVLPVTSDAEVILLRIPAAQNGPLNLAEGERRRFPLREFSGTRYMSYEELRQSFLGDRLLLRLEEIRELLGAQRASKQDPSEVDDRELLETAQGSIFAREIRRRQAKRCSPDPWMMVSVVPVQSKVERKLKQNEPRFIELLKHPPRRRRSGWFSEPNDDPRRFWGGVELPPDYALRRVRVYWNGSVAFDCALTTSSSTWAMDKPAWADRPPLNPLAVAEPVVCTLALANAVWQELSESPECLVEISLLNANGTVLSAAAKNSMAYTHSLTDPPGIHGAMSAVTDDVLVAALPDTPRANELIDSLARDLVVELLKEAGLSPDVRYLPGFDAQGDWKL